MRRKAIPDEYTRADHEAAQAAVRQEMARGEYFHDYMEHLNRAARTRKYNTPLMKRLTCNNFGDKE